MNNKVWKKRLHVAGVNIPKYVLEKIWQQHFPDKPFPNVVGLVLKHKDFIKCLVNLKHKKLAKTTDIAEYGRKLDSADRAAFLMTMPEETGRFKTNNGKVTKLAIVVDEDSIDDWEHILEHELRHIYTGDARTYTLDT